MKPHHKAILIVLGCLIATLVLPVLMAIYWHFVILGIIFLSFAGSLAIVVMFTYIDLKNELEYEHYMDENLTYNFNPMQKRFYYNALKSLRGEK